MTKQTHLALCSGGQDSAVSTYKTMEDGPGEIVIYLDTGTGLEDNRTYIEELCDKYGWQLWTLRTHVDYTELVKENGFPGPSRHSIMYRSLKERQLGRAAARMQGDVHYHTGVRSLESSRRMANVSPEQDHYGKWTWHAPIHDWSKDDCTEFIDEHDIPRNPLWDTLGRSGDCFCGCFGSREELLDLRACGQDDRADWIEALEEQVETGDEKELWAWGSLSDNERRAERIDDDQMMLCSTCGPSYPTEQLDG